MASLENGFPLKRPPSLLSSSSSTNGRLFMQRSRSRITRFFLLEKLDYVLWIWTAATFFFVIILFQAFLPSSVVDKSGNSGQEVAEVTTASRVLGEFGELDFGEGIKFIPYNLMSILERKRERHYNSSVIGPPGKRAAYIRPKIALVGFGFANWSFLVLQSVLLIWCFAGSRRSIFEWRISVADSEHFHCFERDWLWYRGVRISRFSCSFDLDQVGVSHQNYFNRKLNHRLVKVSMHFHHLSLLI